MRQNETDITVIRDNVKGRKGGHYPNSNFMTYR